jgi:hypothetical protein
LFSCHADAAASASLEVRSDCDLDGDDRGYCEVDAHAEGWPPACVGVTKLAWAPEKLTDKKTAQAARTLIDLAHEGDVILPLSAAHLTESPIRGKQRRDVATTMLELSRGWQMRSPLATRQDELRASLGGHHPVAQRVFTLEPDALFADPGPGVQAPPDFPREWADLHRHLTSVMALYNTAIEEEVEPRDRALAIAEQWSLSHHELAEHHRTSNKSAAHIRINARARLMADLRTEIAEAAAATATTQPAFEGWLHERFGRELGEMPYLGRLYEVLVQRLSNADDKWTANDLIDMQFLPCAAGYADVLVAERKTAHYLRQATKRAPAGAFVCATLSDAVSHLAAGRTARG